jgi:hypothetical protein
MHGNPGVAGGAPGGVKRLPLLGRDRHPGAQARDRRFGQPQMEGDRDQQAEDHFGERAAQVDGVVGVHS